jgi:uncharacterized protein YdeI (YjbR/CyaY-like superfamily)
MAEIIDGLEAKTFTAPAAFERWLDAHFADQDGVWIKIAKKGTGVTTVTYDEALTVALCYGWIDGLVNKYDATFYIQRFTPRRAKSVWSVTNTKKVDALTKAGKMKPSGLAAVEAAKKDGRWEAAYASQSTMVMPTDFMAALKANKKAAAFFDKLNKVNKYALYYRLQNAKKPETRQRRIEAFIHMLENNEKLY